MDELVYLYIGVLFGALFIQQCRLSRLQSRVQQLEQGKDAAAETAATEASDPV